MISYASGDVASGANANDSIAGGGHDSGCLGFFNGNGARSGDASGCGAKVATPMQIVLIAVVMAMVWMLIAVMLWH